jgi:hypothetical protein
VHIIFSLRKIKIGEFAGKYKQKIKGSIIEESLKRILMNHQVAQWKIPHEVKEYPITVIYMELEINSIPKSSNV